MLPCGRERYLQHSSIRKKAEKQDLNIFQGKLEVSRFEMIIYPAIDIKDGRCVRLVQGKFNDVTVYSDNPVEMASKI